MTDNGRWKSISDNATNRRWERVSQQLRRRATRELAIGFSDWWLSFRTVREVDRVLRKVLSWKLMQAVLRRLVENETAGVVPGTFMELANLMERDKSLVSKWANGKTQPTQLDYFAMAHVLNLDISNLIPTTEEILFGATQELTSCAQEDVAAYLRFMRDDSEKLSEQVIAVADAVGKKLVHSDGKARG